METGSRRVRSCNGSDQRGELRRRGGGEKWRDSKLRGQNQQGSRVNWMWAHGNGTSG